MTPPAPELTAALRATLVMLGRGDLLDPLPVECAPVGGPVELDAKPGDCQQLCGAPGCESWGCLQ